MGITYGPNGDVFRRPGATLLPAIPPNEDTPIRWLPKPQPDEWGQTIIGYYGGWAVTIKVMIFNDRLCLTELGPLGGDWYSWCYPKGGAAHLAALIWSPETQGEPIDYKKAAARAFGRPREAGERAPWWQVPLV